MHETTKDTKENQTPKFTFQPQGLEKVTITLEVWQLPGFMGPKMLEAIAAKAIVDTQNEYSTLGMVGGYISRQLEPYHQKFQQEVRAELIRQRKGGAK